MGGRVHLRQADDTPGPRDTACPSPLHDYALPSGYREAARVADERLDSGWENPSCPDCDLGGWVPPARLNEPCCDDCPDTPTDEETDRAR